MCALILLKTIFLGKLMATEKGHRMRLSPELTQLHSSPRGRSVVALHRARNKAYHEGEYVEQESFVTAPEILALAQAAQVAAGALVLDLCCGTGGPALYLAQEIGCRIVGVDRSPEAVRLAQTVAETRVLTQRASFLVGDACQLPLATFFDAALLLETMLAIEDKAALLHEVSRLLRPGSRFGLTLEEGQPLSLEEQQRISEGESIWLLPEREFLEHLERAGFQVIQIEDHTATHAAVAQRLAAAFYSDHDTIVAELGSARWNEIVAAHVQWVEWLTTRRVRKLVFVVERISASTA
jgi:SAM-dependent methyltransferase